MSRTIEIRNLPDAFVEQLERAAAREGITVQQLVVEQLSEAVPSGVIELDEWLRQEAALRARGLSPREITRIIHAGRLERDAQIDAALRASRVETRVW